MTIPIVVHLEASVVDQIRVLAGEDTVADWLRQVAMTRLQQIRASLARPLESVGDIAQVGIENMRRSMAWMQQAQGQTLMPDGTMKQWTREEIDALALGARLQLFERFPELKRWWQDARS